MLMAAVKVDDDALQWASPDLLADQSVVLEAVRRPGTQFLWGVFGGLQGHSRKHRFGVGLGFPTVSEDKPKRVFKNEICVYAAERLSV